MVGIIYLKVYELLMNVLNSNELYLKDWNYE
jgi:hypothetical protein